jgi:hypothetical protein
VAEDAERPSPHFQPLRPASRARLIVGFVLGPLFWLVALVVTAWVFTDHWAIALGLLVACGVRKLGSRGGTVFVDESAESVSALD